MKKRRETKEEKLAYERTIYSKERTMLAYFRTALTALLFGIALMNFFHNNPSYFFGVLFTVIGIAFFIIGFRYWPHRGKMKNKSKIEEKD